MEEKVVGGKDKKYVLYTVVGEEKGKASVGVWVVRVLLASLLLIALAVVPYVSLRLAQVNDRPLVVYQPVPVNEHGSHHRQNHPNHLNGPLKVASLTHHNETSTSVPSTDSASTVMTSASPSTVRQNSSSVTLHESAATLSILEDVNSTKVTEAIDEVKNGIDEEETTMITTADSQIKEIISLSSTTMHQSSNEIITAMPTESEKSLESTSTTKANKPVVENENDTSKESLVKSSTSKSSSTHILASKVKPTTEIPDLNDKDTKPTEIITENTTTLKINQSQSIKTTTSVPSSSKLLSILGSSPSTATKVNNNYKTSTSTVALTHKPLAHKLVYIATTSAGNHVGGFAVWKTDKTVTEWSYFFENIPIEYQSLDNTDHEMRGMLAAVRTWSHKWQDYHVVLRSHHQAIENSKHPTRLQLGKEIEELSEGHFTYEFEWRTRRSDKLVEISNCLARLYRNYNHWLKEFQQNVTNLLGVKEWNDDVMRDHAVQVPKKAFYTEMTEDNVVEEGKKDHSTSTLTLSQMLKPSSPSGLKF